MRLDTSTMAVPRGRRYAVCLSLHRTSKTAGAWSRFSKSSLQNIWRAEGGGEEQEQLEMSGKHSDIDSPGLLCGLLKKKKKTEAGTHSILSANAE